MFAEDIHSHLYFKLPLWSDHPRQTLLPGVSSAIYSISSSKTLISLRGLYSVSIHGPDCTVNSALRPESLLSAKPALIQWDLWAPCYKQQASARDSQPSRSNDSTLWSAVCCQHEGFSADLFWLVSISLRETKQGEKAEGSLVRACVYNSLTTRLCDTIDVVFPPLKDHWPPHCGGHAFCFALFCVCVCVLNIFFFFSSWGAVNNLWTKSAAHLKWPSATVTVSSNPNPLTDNHLWNWELPTFSVLPSLQWGWGPTWHLFSLKTYSKD